MFDGHRAVYLREMSDLPLPIRDRTARAGRGLAWLAPALLALTGMAAILMAPGAAWTAPVVAMGATVAGLSLAARGLGAGHPHTRLGSANAVTALRGALVAALAAAVLHGAVEPGATLFTLAALAVLVLDGVDGALARAEGLASAFGARFDMEVDSVLAASLAVAIAVAVPQTLPGLAALTLLGGARYAFAGASLALPWLDDPLPPRWSRKAVCVAQIATLIGVLVLHPVLPMIDALLVPVAALVLWSFGRDVIALRRLRP